ncbi:hypothetical protein CEXT_724461, partial [Caerostris extrusa]
MLLVCVSVYRNHTRRTVTQLLPRESCSGRYLGYLVCLPPTVLGCDGNLGYFGRITWLRTLFA